jgi:hypothetical protein
LYFLTEEEEEELKEDPLYAEYVISRCGPGMSGPDEKVLSDLLYRRHYQESPLSLAEEVALRELTYMSCWHDAGIAAAIEVQNK